MATHDRDIVNKLKNRVIEISNEQISQEIYEGGYGDVVEYSQMFM